MQTQELGDYIGAESCADFRHDMADVASPGAAGAHRHRCQRRPGKEYPPAMPSLVMKKYSTSDGRLVIKEEKVERRRREYFQAHRSGGRLLLKLVPVEEGCDGDGGDEGVSGRTAEEMQYESSQCGGDGVNPCGGFVVAEFPPPVLT